MNYILYGKHKDDKSYGAMNLVDGSIGVGLMFATLIPNLERAKHYACLLYTSCLAQKKIWHIDKTILGFLFCNDFTQCYHISSCCDYSV